MAFFFFCRIWIHGSHTWTLVWFFASSAFMDLDPVSSGEKKGLFYELNVCMWRTMSIIDFFKRNIKTHFWVAETKTAPPRYKPFCVIWRRKRDRESIKKKFEWWFKTSSLPLLCKLVKGQLKTRCYMRLIVFWGGNNFFLSLLRKIDNRNSEKLNDHRGTV